MSRKSDGSRELPLERSGERRTIPFEAGQVYLEGVEGTIHLLLGYHEVVPEEELGVILEEKQEVSHFEHLE